MFMRVVNSMISSTILRNLNKNMDKLNKLQEQVSTTRRINRPSDDPAGIVDSLRLRTGLEEMDKYSTNAKDAQSWLEATDSALNDAVNMMHRVRELAVKASNSYLTPTELEAVSKEINQIKNQMVQTGNSTYAGRSIFSGTMTQDLAYDSLGVYQGNSGMIEYEIGAGVRLPINTTGEQAFGDVFTTLDGLMTDITAGNISEISNTDLGKLDDVLNQMLGVRADIGARINRTELVINRADELNVNMTDLLSKVEDADLAQVMMKLKVQENVYQASLQVGARIITPTLMDFLR